MDQFGAQIIVSLFHDRKDGWMPTALHATRSAKLHNVNLFPMIAGLATLTSQHRRRKAKSMPRHLGVGHLEQQGCQQTACELVAAETQQVTPCPLLGNASGCVSLKLGIRIPLWTMARALGDAGAFGGEHGAGHGQPCADGRVQLTTGNRSGGNASSRDAGADSQAEIEVLLPGLANGLTVGCWR